MASKVALLGVNVLIALLDIKHKHHHIATNWLFDWLILGNRWAICPITQNGCVRILSLLSYENGFGILETKDRLSVFIHKSHHTFIPDNISLLQDDLINWQYIQGAKQLTDAYLLALAKYNQAIFVSLDGRIETNTVVDVRDGNFVSLLG